MEVHGEFDWETYSEAGYVWDEAKNKWKSLPGVKQGKKGLGVVGTFVYAQHPTTEILTLSYRLPAQWPNGRVYIKGTLTQRWRPGLPLPQDLFDYLAAGGVLEAHNVMFERAIWEYVAHRRMGWPSLEPFVQQLRCSMAKARVNALPGALANLSDVLKLPTPKDADGKRLLDKYSVPRNPTKADPRTRIRPTDPGEEVDGEKLYLYCDRDLDAEQGASSRMWPMAQDEHEFWLIDQEINWRGMAVDRPAVRDCIAVLEQALDHYGDEFRTLTGGLNPTQLAETKGWLAAQGVVMFSMDEDAIDEALAKLAPHPPGGCYKARRALEIRQLIGSASVKKLYAMENQADAGDRIRNMIIHHGARTGRPTGEGAQPLNLPKAGPELRWCGMAPDGKLGEGGCHRPFKPSHTHCPWCSRPVGDAPKREWSWEAVDYALEIMSARSLELVEWYFGDALLTISGCVRGLFVAAPGHELIASDYSAIEAVVTAMLSGCEWRIEAFRNNEPIYLLSASKITGTPVQTYLDYKRDTGQHHPDRQKIGKVAELAGGFGGWISAWRAFGFQGSDDEAKGQILGWRKASPEIPEMWGGQVRRQGWSQPPREEYYGFEGAAVQAIQHPGHVFTANGIKFYVRNYRPPVTEWRLLSDPLLYGDDVARWAQVTLDAGYPGELIIQLLSGRELTYHNARVSKSSKSWASPWEVDIHYMTWNSNPKYGMMGWVPMNTYGGRLTENIVQAIAHDILRHAIKKLRLAGYPTVLHVYDEIVVEVPVGLGSVEEVERIMAEMAWWCADWPVRASGGWRGRRFRKD